jgi:hypothetical protein
MTNLAVEIASGAEVFLSDGRICTSKGWVEDEGFLGDESLSTGWQVSLPNYDVNFELA